MATSSTVRSRCSTAAASALTSMPLERELGDPAEDHGLGRSRGGYGSELHPSTERGGKPRVVMLTAGQRHESTQAVVQRWRATRRTARSTSATGSPAMRSKRGSLSGQRGWSEALRSFRISGAADHRHALREAGCQLSGHGHHCLYLRMVLALQTDPGQYRGSWGACVATPTPMPPPPAATPVPLPPPPPAQTNCDPSCPDVCIPPISQVGDLDCGDNPDWRFRMLPPDP